MYPLGALSSLIGSKIIIGINTYFAGLDIGDEIYLNGVTTAIKTVYNDTKIEVENDVSGVINDIVYAVKKSVYYKYLLWKTETYIANYNMDLFGAEAVKSGNKEVRFNNNRTPLSELLKLKNFYETELQKALDEENGEDVWNMRRMETGTL